MKANEIRRRFLDYFARNGHTVVPSSSLIPKGDPTLLFTNAGMVQFKGVFLGEERREYTRAVSCQRCMRAGGKHNDLENVGRTARHHTLFEMLGNFSFGDYFKEGAIGYAWEFLTKEMGLRPEVLWITVFKDDDAAAGIWERVIGIPRERIVRRGEEDNFWAMGDTGPCGPCSEIVIDQGEGVGCGRPTCRVGCDCDRFMELWNLVFMQYNRDSKGQLTPLPNPSIDTGMGLERLAAVVQGKKGNYDTDLFTPIISYLEDLTQKAYGEEMATDTSMKVIADHSRAITFLITDGVLPSNEGRGYVLRRIIRRAGRHGKLLGLGEPFLYKVIGCVIDLMGDTYPEIRRARDLIVRAVSGEEERFLETLVKGLGILEEEVKTLKKKGERVIPGGLAFRLYDTYGFPLDLTADIVRGEGFSLDEEGFNRAMEGQRLRAREAWKGSGEEAIQELYKRLMTEGIKTSFVGYHMDVISSKVICIIKDGKVVESASHGDRCEVITEDTPFYGESGGQVGDIGVILGKALELEVVDTKKPFEELIVHHCLVKEGKVSTGMTVELIPDMKTRKATSLNHTATHLLHATLRAVLGGHVRQSGSLVSPKRLRFDFTHFSSLGDMTLKVIEDRVNEGIRENMEVSIKTLSYQEAIERGALAFFGERYGDVVRMVEVDGFSRELCGGIHTRRTGDIGLFKIIGESSIAAGVRRIEAVTGGEAIHLIRGEEETLKEGAHLLKTNPKELPDRITRLLEHERLLEREIERLKDRIKGQESGDLLVRVKKVADVNVLAEMVEIETLEDLRGMADDLRTKMGSGVVILGGKKDGKAILLVALTKDLVKRFHAGDIIKELATIVGGKGGGRPDIAQAGGDRAEALKSALERGYKIIEGRIKG